MERKNKHKVTELKENGNWAKKMVSIFPKKKKKKVITLITLVTQLSND